MFLQVLAQTCLVVRPRQVLVQRSISPRAQVLVVCLEVQPLTQQEVYLAEQLRAVSLGSNQLLNVSVAFLQIHVGTLSIQVLRQGSPRTCIIMYQGNWDNLFVASGACCMYIKEYFLTKLLVCERSLTKLFCCCMSKCK